MWECSEWTAVVERIWCSVWCTVCAQWRRETLASWQQHGVPLWVFTVGVHSGCSLRVFTAGVHSGCSQWVFTVGVLCACSLCVFTVGVLCGCSLWVFRDGGTKESARCDSDMAYRLLRLEIAIGCSHDFCRNECAKYAK